MANTPDSGSSWLAALIPLAMGLFGGGSGSSESTSNPVTDAMIRRLLGEQENRMKLQNPLYEEVTQLARSLMPKSSRPSSYTLPTIGTNPGTMPTPTRPAPTKPDNPTTSPVSQAVTMLSSGISPLTQAKLFRR